MKIRIATRKSQLALWQARFVAEKLRELEAVSAVELLPLSTRGDEILDKSLQKIGGKGLFIKELEVAMQSGAADIAVHSMKDVPADMPSGFRIAAVLKRANSADALLSRDGLTLEQLPQGACIGSSSLRRQAQLKSHRPDVEVKPLRGNVNTRLQKLQDGEYDAIVLASAGLERLGFESQISQQFEPQQMLPAAAQGVIGIECLDTASELAKALRLLQHDETASTTAAERAVAARLQADCQSPVASFATVEDSTLTLTALVALPDGSRILRDSQSGSTTEAEALGQSVADRLLELGAADMLGTSQP